MRRNDAGRPLRLALTGGLAAGKSTVSRLLEAAGAATLDTDEVAHGLMQPGHAVYAKVVESFGAGILAADGSIDRVRLGQQVFEDPAALRRLNECVHPGVRTEVAAWLVEQESAGRHAVVTVPLLFEAGMAEGWDAILCVTAPMALVRERLRARGLADAEADARLAAQWPVKEKKKRADIVIENGGSLAELKQRVSGIWRELTQKEQLHHG